jgi:FkbM family methyltransferase
VSSSLLSWSGRVLRKAGTLLLERGGTSGTWIDVGAHHGEVTLGHAEQNPGLKVYAFEPNLRVAASLIGRAPNFIVIPIAVAESDGQGQLQVNTYDDASSMLSMDENVRRAWVGGEALQVEAQVAVPTIRLDTFMSLFSIASVDFLKVDTQGMDLAVIRSAGSRLRDIVRIRLEVDLSPEPLYRGAASKDEVMEFMSSAGFRLVATEVQAYGQEQNLTFERTELGESESIRLVVGQRSGRDGIQRRAWRFWQKPWRDKSLALGVRWRKWLPWIPFPIRLSFGSWWLVRENQLGESLFWHRRFAEEETGLQFLERFLQPGMIVVDAGAHEGYYTLFASRRVGRTGKVIAFEPSPRERKALRWHVLVNQCWNVRIQGLALGSEAGEAEFHIVDGAQTGLNSLKPPAILDGTSIIKVQVTSLDDWVRAQNLDRVDFIKLDVEGAELSVVKGASGLLRRRPRPVIYAEVEDRRTQPWGYPAREIVATLDALEYEWFRPELDGKLVSIGPEREGFQANLVAVPKERREEVLSRAKKAC